MPRWIVVSGGVLSGLGKGVVSASIGKLISNYRVVPIKCDGYLNVDPGTMNPFEHGEVFVLDDGGEVDMDFGHYERFIGISAKKDWNLTSGKVFLDIIKRERNGEYLGKTVQIIPHVTDSIKNNWKSIAKSERADVVIIEIGGTIGDIENLIFFEAARQLRLEEKYLIYVHVTYVPELEAVGEQKTKPTQQSVTLLLQRGIQPDIIICRSKRKLSDKARSKIALFANLSKKCVISAPDVTNIYELPLIFKEQGIAEIISNKLDMDVWPDLDRWKALVKNLNNTNKKLKIAICGKYTELHDSYISIKEALTHAGAALSVKPELSFIDTSTCDLEEELRGFHGIIVPGGFGSRGAEGKVKAISIARENNIPFLGLCFGFQLAVIEFARNVCGLAAANSTEIEPKCRHPVIFLLPNQRGIKKKGATMRLGAQEIKIKPGTKAYKLTKSGSIKRRFRHRYEVNPKFVPLLESKGLVFSGTNQDGSVMQILELPSHRFFLATQFHPEFSSKLEQPEPFFSGFLRTCME